MVLTNCSEFVLIVLLHFRICSALLFPVHKIKVEGGWGNGSPPVWLLNLKMVVNDCSQFVLTVLLQIRTCSTLFSPVHKIKVWGPKKWQPPMWFLNSKMVRNNCSEFVLIVLLQIRICSILPSPVHKDKNWGGGCVIEKIVCHVIQQERGSRRLDWQWRGCHGSN